MGVGGEFESILVSLLLPTESTVARILGPWAVLQYIQACALKREDGCGVVERVNYL